MLNWVSWKKGIPVNCHIWPFSCMAFFMGKRPYICMAFYSRKKAISINSLFNTSRDSIQKSPCVKFKLCGGKYY